MKDQTEYDRRCIEAYLKKMRPDDNYAVAVKRTRNENGSRDAIISLNSEDDE